MQISRRHFVRGAAVAGLSLRGVMDFADAAQTEPSAPPTPLPTAAVVDPARGAELRWLGDAAPAESTGVTWGVSWPMGTFQKGQPFKLDHDLPLQTWPTAYWPDGSLKWTAHATIADAAKAKSLRLTPGQPASPAKPLTVTETSDVITIDTGVLRATIRRTGTNLIDRIERDGKPIVSNVSLICMRQDAAICEPGATVTRESFASAIEAVTVEQHGPVRAVVKLTGKHANASRQWLPFSVRLYFYAGGDSARIMHSFVFDGDEHKDFLCGLGVKFNVTMQGELYDRHIRFGGQDGGLWAEGVRNLSGLRRDPGRDVIDAQLAGKPCPPVSEFAESVSSRLNLIPAWDGYSLFQSSADAFSIKKRTAGEGVSWITAAHGNRAPGFGYIGSPTGGAAFGLRDFWQRHPTQLDVTGTTKDQAEVTLWMYSPSAPAMDMRFYHDDMGMLTHPQQLEGLNITYEDYEPGYSTPYGIARSSELTLWALPATPSRERLVNMAAAVAEPGVLVCPPGHYHACKLFGNVWGLPDRSTPQSTRIENLLDWYVDYYRTQVEQRRWYGFWDYGDVMHTYDVDRHCWRYDVGGFAWDNSELSPDLWLWYSFLRTGDKKIFRLAEAMTRHTGEVDVYHLGKFAMLGSRHNVMHWGCSAKQLRIGTVVYRRFYYYLTADERVGDLMYELAHAEQTFVNVDPIRKIRVGEYHPQPHALAVGMGTDWGSLAAAWLTEWERTGDETYKTKIANGMKTLAAMPHGLFSNGGLLDPDTGVFTNNHGDAVDISHLSAVFGLPEICAELIQLLDVPEFVTAWLNYCEFYNADVDTRRKALGFTAKADGLASAHSRLTAYAAWKKNDATLAARAWNEFFREDSRATSKRYSLKTTRIDGPSVLHPIDEAAWVSTNDTAQWGLCAIENLALIGKYVALASRL